MIGSASPFLAMNLGQLCSALKYVIIVNLACCDVGTDFLNGLGLLYTENWLYGVCILLCIWIPGICCSLSNQNVTNPWKELLTLTGFPFLMIFNGILSLVGCDQAKSKKAEQDFLDMKRFELMFEAPMQLMLNASLIARKINNGWFAYLSFSFSMLSAIVGAIGLTGSLAEEQKNIKDIQPLGRLMVTLIIARPPFAAIFFCYLIHDADVSPELFVIAVGIFCLSIVYFFEENIYLFGNRLVTGQRITRHDQTNILRLKIKFWILQPTFASLRHSLLYSVVFIFTKILPNLAITGFSVHTYLKFELINSKSVTDAYGWFDKVVFTYIFLVLQVVFSILHCIYPCKPELFFTEASPSDDEDLGDIELGCGAEDEPNSIESARDLSDGDYRIIELGSEAAEDEP